MLRKWRESFARLEETAKDVLAENSGDVVKLLQEQLRQTGLDGDNNLLKPYSAASYEMGYVAEKIEMNPRTADGIPDLYYTGASFNKMYLRLTADSMELTSADAKWQILQKDYGFAIGKLDTESRNGLRKGIMQPGMVRKIAAQTGCGIG